MQKARTGTTSKKKYKKDCIQRDTCRYYDECPFHHDIVLCREYYDRTMSNDEIGEID